MASSLLWFAAIVIFFGFMMRKGGGCCGSDHDHGKQEGQGTSFDPICGMPVDPGKTSLTSSYQGKTVYFCSPHCKEEFDADPGLYEEKIRSQQAMHHGCCG